MELFVMQKESLVQWGKQGTANQPILDLLSSKNMFLVFQFI